MRTAETRIRLRATSITISRSAPDAVKPKNWLISHTKANGEPSVPPIPKNTKRSAKIAAELSTPLQLTRTSNPYEFENPVLKTLLKNRNELLRLSISESSAARRVLRRFSTWLTKVVTAVGNGIHEFWSSIILEHARRNTISLYSSPTATAGEQKNYVPKLGSVVSFARTAIESIQSSNRSTIPMTTSKRPCETSSASTILSSRAEEIVNGLADGTLDLTTVTLAEFVQVSFLRLVSFDETHLEQTIMYGGNVFKFHACVSEIQPMQSIVGDWRVQ